MPLRAIDIKPGQWLIISATEPRPSKNTWNPQAEPVCDGFPFKVKAISLPFIAIQLFSGQSATIDTRLHSFVKARPRYVQELIDNVDGHPEARLEERKKPLRRRRRRELQPAGHEIIDPAQCTNCGGRCSQRMNSKARCWEFVCTNCGHNQGPVPE